MRKSFLIVLMSVATLVTGCATKKYVRQTAAPIQTKVDQVADQSNRQGTEITATRADVAKNTTAISAVDEKATTADRRAGEAMNRANEANQKAEQDSREITALRGVVANLDDYKVTGQATVMFPVNRATLSKDDKAQLDMIASGANNLKRYFVAVEGYTDSTGTPAYNLELSKRRADAVVQYLVGDKDMKFYNIRTIGLGEAQPVDPGKNRAARAKNRRVEVKIFSADNAGGAGAGGSR